MAQQSAGSTTEAAAALSPCGRRSVPPAFKSVPASSSTPAGKLGQATEPGPAGNTRATAIAASPSPRPVKPSPSVVVADTDTAAPTA